MDIFREMAERGLMGRKEKYTVHSDEYYEKRYDSLPEKEKTGTTREKYVKTAKEIDSLLERDWEIYARLEKI